MKKRLISLFMAIVMIATFLPWSGIVAFARENATSTAQNPASGGVAFGDNQRRPIPNVSLDVTDVTRVANSQYSMIKGTAIVAATPSGVPELSSAVSWRSQAYAGETPTATKVTFVFNGFDNAYSKFNPAILGSPTLTCVNNPSVSFSGPVINGNQYVWTLTGGSAKAGEVLKFKIACSVSWDNIYTYTKITDTYEILGYSYVENIVYPAGAFVYTTVAKNNSSARQCGDVRYISRVLGKGVYGSIPTNGTTDGEINRGYHDFASNNFVNSTDAAMCATWFWSPDRSGSSSYDYNGSTANDSNRSTATAYMDTSVQTLENMNLRMNFFEYERPRGADDEPGIPQQFNGFVVKNSFVTSYDQNVSSDTAAVAALNPVIASDNTLTEQFDATQATLYGAGGAGDYTLIPYFYFHDGTTGVSASSKNNHTRVATNLKIVAVNKGTLRTNINGAGVSWAQTTTSRTPVNGTDAQAIGISGAGKGLIPQSWYYSAGWSDYCTYFDNANKMLVNTVAAQADIDYAATNLSDYYGKLTLKTADSTRDYYGTVYNTTYSNPIPGVSNVNTGYYSTTNKYTALKPLSTLIAAASEGSAYNIYYNGESSLTNILQFWPNSKEYYTADSRLALEKALAEAQDVSANNYNTLYQLSVDQASRNLQNAIEMLKFAPLDLVNANSVYSLGNKISSYSPVYNPFTVADRYAYVSMSGTTYETVLPNGTSVYTYTLESRNAANLAYNSVGTYVNNAASYDSRSQGTLNTKVTALQSALNNLAYATAVSTYWDQVTSLVETIPRAALNLTHRAAIDALLLEGNNLRTGKTENQAKLNQLADTLFLYLYTEPSDYTVVDTAIVNSACRNDKLTAINPAGGNREVLYKYTTPTRTALQALIDTAESKRPVYDGEGNLISVKLPIIDKAEIVSMANGIATAAANLKIAGADFYYVNEQINVVTACDETHYTAASWLTYAAALNKAKTALQTSGANANTGWQATSTSAQYLASNQSGENGPDVIAAALYAARTALVHKKTTITFDLNYGATPVYTTQTDLSGDATVALPTPPTRTGFIFGGWFSEAACTNAVSLPQTFPLADATYYAKWTAVSYSVTFDGNGNTGGSMTAQSIPYGTSAQLKANGFIKAGHNFIGWSTTLGGAVAYTDGGQYTMTAPGSVLYAVWTVNSYDIIYIVDDVEIQRVPYKYGQSITPIAEPVKEGYTFSGWPEMPATMPAGNLTVMGSFTINSYNIVYKVNGKVYATETYNYNAMITPVGEPVKEGYKFSGWSPVVPTRMPIGGVEINGTFTANTYNVMYYLNGAFLQKDSYKFGEKIILPAVNPPKGYSFSGWSNISETMPAKSLVCAGSYVVNSYNAVFKVDGVLYATVPTNYDAAIVLPTEPTKAGFTFAGWDSVPAKMPANDIEINARWATTQHTVTFYVNNEVYKTITGAIGDPLTAPAVTPPAGHSFSGWLQTVPATIPSSDMNIYGNYIANDYTISFYINGEIYTSITQAYGTSVTAPIVDVPANHTFSGWNPAIPATMPAENMSINASMVKTSATVSFNLNGGTGTLPSAINEVIGTKITLPAQGNIVREGYKFLGWATAASATQALLDYAVPENDVTLYAVWEKTIAPKLVAVSGSTTVIDEERGYIYGLTTGIDEYVLESYITTLGNAHIEYEYGMSMGTGTKVKLVENDTKEVLATYYIVIFGDIDGDGFINGNDSSISSATAAWLNVLPQDSPYRFAADIDGMEGFNGSDASYLVAVIAHTSQLDQRTGTII